MQDEHARATCNVFGARCNVFCTVPARQETVDKVTQIVEAVFPNSDPFHNLAEDICVVYCCAM